MFPSVQFWHWTLGLGVAGLALGAVFLATPSGPQGPVARFPRMVWAGRLLSAVAFLWAAWVLHVRPLEFLLPVQKWIWPVFIASIPLSWYAMPDLLSCRATGGLLCLLPAPVLAVGRFHPSSWRLPVIVFLYILVVAGMDFVMNPHHLRNALAWCAAKPVRQRSTGAALAILGIALALLALGVFHE